MGGARCAQVNGGINYLLSILDLQITLRVTGVIFYLVLLIPLGVYGICLWVSFMVLSLTSFHLARLHLLYARRHRDELQQILDFEFIRQLDEELLAKKKKKRHYLHPDLAELARLNNAKKDPEQ
jgi:hypothetical protein